MTQTGPLEDSFSHVLDASALLALLRKEPGADTVSSVLRRSVVSSVNWSEVFQKALVWDIEVRNIREGLEALGLHILPFTAQMAEEAARLWANTKQAGLSLGDRACLGLALNLRLPVLTSDRAWAVLDLATEVQVIR